jgi:hypothetical protein
MQAIKRTWSRGAGGKLIVGVGTIVALCCSCSALAVVVSPSLPTPTPGPVAAALAAAKPSASAEPTTTTKPGEPSSTPAPTATTAPTETSAPTATPEPTETTEPTETPEPTITPIVVNSQVIEGRGDKIVTIEKPDVPVILSLTHAGRSNFIVQSVNADNEKTDTLVNEIGKYAGTVLLDVDDGSSTKRLVVKADGRWRIVLDGLLTAPHIAVPGEITHTGDGVYLVDGDVDTIEFKHSGKSNFVVVAYARSGKDLLVNEIGAYEGLVLAPKGTLLIEVKADGKWTAVTTSR